METKKYCKLSEYQECLHEQGMDANSAEHFQK